MFSAATATDPEPKSLGNIEANDLTSNQQIVPVPYLAGRRFIAGQQLTDVFSLVTKTEQRQTVKGKGGSDSGTKIDYGTFALSFCMGGRQPVDAIFKIIVGTDIVWKSDSGVWFGGAEYVDITVENYGTARFYKGSWTQPIDARLAPRGAIPSLITYPDFDRREPQTWPYRAAAGGETTHLGLPSGETNPIDGHYDAHSAYRPICYGVFIKWRIGRSGSPVGNIKVELQRSVPWFAGSAADRDATGLNSTDEGVNPIGVIYDLVTDPTFGLGRAAAALYQAGWETALPLTSWLRIAPLITNFASAKSLLATLISPWGTDTKSYLDGFLRERDGLLDIGVFDHGLIDTNNLPLLTDDDLDGEAGLEPTNFDDVSTTFWISFSDKDHFYQRRPQKYDDPSVRAQVGEEIRVIDEREWITGGAIAKRWVTESGRIRTLPGQSGPVPVKREWLDNAPKVGGGTYGQVREGDRFLWSSASKGFSLLLWIAETEWPEDRSGQTTLHVENERGYWPSLYIPPADTSLGDYRIKPVEIVTHAVKELPAGLKTNVAAQQVAVLALRTDAAMLGFHVHVGVTSSSFMPASLRNSFAVFGKVKSATYPSSTGALDIATGMVLDLYGPDLDQLTPQSDQQRDDNSWLCFCQNEIMSVGDVVALGSGRYRIYFRRALYNTALGNHPVDTDVWFIRRDHLTPIENANFISGSTRYFKLQPYTQDQEMALADVGFFSYNFAALTPELLAPFGLKISNLYLVDLGGGVFAAHVVFTWDYSIEQDVASFDIAYRAGATSAAMLADFTVTNVACTNVIIYDSTGVATVKRQRLDLVVGSSNGNYQVKVRAIDSAGIPSDYSFSLSRRIVSSTDPEPSKFHHFTSQAELQAYAVTNLTVGDLVFVTIAGQTHYRQLQSGAPSESSDWSVLGESAMRWRMTGGLY